MFDFISYQTWRITHIICKIFKTHACIYIIILFGYLLVFNNNNNNNNELQKNSTSFVIFIQQLHSKFEGQEFQAC